MEEWFVVEKFQEAMDYDQVGPYCPAINPSLESPEEIIDFMHYSSTILYDKTAAVLRMLKYLVTENLFHESLKAYLTTTSL